MHKTLKILALATYATIATLAGGTTYADNSSTYVSGAAHPSTLVEEHLFAEGFVQSTEDVKIKVSFDTPAPDVAISIDALNYDVRSARFAARFITNENSNLILRGKAEAIIDVLLPSRRISSGEIITERDVQNATMPVQAMSANMLRSQRDIVGKEAKRTLMPGRPIASHALIEPRVILRGEEVIVKYNDSDLKLTVPGRTLEDGAQNEVIKVVNLQSSKIIHAQVIAPGLLFVKPVNTTTYKK